MTLSDFGDGIDDPFLVTDPSTKEPFTGCFVLRPSQEVAAFNALVKFRDYLSDEDPRKDKIRNYLERLGNMWKGEE